MCWTEIGWLETGFTGFYRVLLGFTGFYRVLPGFTGFYRVLPGFDGRRSCSVARNGEAASVFNEDLARRRSADDRLIS